MAHITLLLMLTFLSLCCEGQVWKEDAWKEEQYLTWCTTSDAEQRKCKTFSEAVEKDSDKFVPTALILECVQAFNRDECMKYLDEEKAEVTSLDPGQVFIGGRYHSLVPILHEVYVGEETTYYAVAVVKRNTLNDVEQLKDLQGKRACFAGVGSQAGWVIPVYTLMKEKAMKVIDCNNHVKSAINFFGPSCAVNSLVDKYNPLGDNSNGLCQLCKGKALGQKCTDSDPYSGFEGAFRCLVEEGEIAFLKHTTVEEMLSGIEFGSIRSDDFELLCNDGTRRKIQEYQSCNWGIVPAHTVVTSSAKPLQARISYQKFLQRAVKLYGGAVKNQTVFYPFEEKKFYLFESADRYGQQHNLLFQDNTIDVGIIPENDQTYKGYLKNSLDFILSIRHCPIGRMTLCVTSNAELNKCVKMRTALKAQLLKPEMVCYKGHSHVNCMQAIRNGDADVAVFDAGDVYTAGHQYSLIPIIAEVYNLQEPFYYAVAVAKQENLDTELVYLKNRNTCHSGIGKGAGWVIPMAFLISNERMRSYGCDSVRAAAEYFSKSCVPGAMNREYNVGKQVGHLCDLCHGSSFSFCARDASEDYYGDTGAFRCLVEGGGDVAFVKHTTVMENTDGKRKEWWARNQLTSDYELLCRDGSRATVGQYATCNMGEVRANAVVTRGGSAYNQPEVDAFVNLFLYAQQFYGRKVPDEFTFSMFYSEPPYSDLIFQDATQQLKVLQPQEQNYRTYLGPDFLKAMAAVDCRAGAAWQRGSLSAVFVAFVVCFIAGKSAV